MLVPPVDPEHPQAHVVLGSGQEVILELLQVRRLLLRLLDGRRLPPQLHRRLLRRPHRGGGEGRGEGGVRLVSIPQLGIPLRSPG